MAHTELGAQLLDRFAEGCEEAAVIEKKPLLDGRNMTMILAPKKTK
jgi:translation initiation factor IF-3